jgi:hypothetical protein
MQFPEKVYVLISTHGVMTINPIYEEPNVYKVPEGITVTKISSVTPGTCNYLEQSFLDQITDFIQETVNQEPMILTQQQMVAENINRKRKRDLNEKKTPEELISYFLFKNEPYTESLRRKIKNENFDDIDDVRAYLRSYKYFINTYVSGKIIPNKTYSYDTLDPIEPSNFIKQIGKNNKTFDVLSVLKKTIEGQKKTTTYTYEKDIVEFFQNHGVKQIVLIDLSCSAFLTSEGKRPTERTTRFIRRRVYKTQKGAYKNKNKKNKHRKNNRTRKTRP